MSKRIEGGQPADVVSGDVSDQLNKIIAGLGNAGDDDGQYTPDQLDADVAALAELCPECNWNPADGTDGS